METIITGGKQYRSLAELSILKKKIICYNAKQKILLYQQQDNIYIPGVVGCESFFETFGFDIKEDKLDPFLRLIQYQFEYHHQNNKLFKKYLEYIREYNGYYMPFDQSIVKQFKPVMFDDGTVANPTVLGIEEAMELSKQKKYYNHTVLGLNVLYEKMKEEKIC